MRRSWLWLGPTAIFAALLVIASLAYMVFHRHRDDMAELKRNKCVLVEERRTGRHIFFGKAGYRSEIALEYHCATAPGVRVKVY